MNIIRHMTSREKKCKHCKTPLPVPRPCSQTMHKECAVEYHRIKDRRRWNQRKRQRAKKKADLARLMKTKEGNHATV